MAIPDYTQDLSLSGADALGPAGCPPARLAEWTERAARFAAELVEARRAGTLPLLSIADTVADLPALEPLVRHLTADARDIVLLGTGGSSLGAQAIAQATGRLTPGHLPTPDRPRLHVFDNLDGASLAAAFAALDLRTTRFLAVSKSGSTGETLLQTLAAVKAIEDAGGGQWLDRHFAFVTEPGPSAMRTLAAELKAPVAEHPTGIGGRYSVLSVTGALPALLMGEDPRALRAGAQGVLDALGLAPGEAPAVAGAALLAAMIAEQGLRQIVLWPYADRLERFAMWWRQLWGESIGKAGRGATPIPALGPVDQHSQLQLYLDGPNDKHLTIMAPPLAGIGPAAHPGLAARIGAAYLAGRTPGDLVAAQARATADTLARRGRPVRVLRTAALGPRTLGALFMHFMLETIIACRLLGVDPFDQPAVEEGKVLARQYLAEGRA